MPHISDFNYHRVSVHNYAFLFLLINTVLVLLSISLWKLISPKLLGQGLVTGYCPWCSSGQDLPLLLLQPDFNL